MQGMDREKVAAYVRERERIDAKVSTPPLAIWLLNLVNRVFKTAFREGPEDYMVIYERSRKKMQLLSTLSPCEKVAVGLRLGQFYTNYDFGDNVFGLRSFSMLKDYSAEQQTAYRKHWDAYEIGEDSVLRGPIVGDYPQNQLTPREEAEVEEIRRLRAEAGPGERTVLRWGTVDVPGRMTSR
jgi:hypothetical protein